jgi:hypothetical protein
MTKLQETRMQQAIRRDIDNAPPLTPEIEAKLVILLQPE